MFVPESSVLHSKKSQCSQTLLQCLKSPLVHLVRSKTQQILHSRPSSAGQDMRRVSAVKGRRHSSYEATAADLSVEIGRHIHHVHLEGSYCSKVQTGKTEIDDLSRL